MENKEAHEWGMERIKQGDIYPLTVIKDRYDGTYSGGKYTAWLLEYYNIPEDIDADDTTTMNFWYNDVEEKGKYIVGLGNTSQEAIDDLQKKCIEKDYYYWGD